jgi:hypothetical protein
LDGGTDEGTAVMDEDDGDEDDDLFEVDAYDDE